MTEHTASSPRRLLAVLAGAFALAVVHHLLFFEHRIGVSYPLFAVLLYGYAYAAAGDRLRRPGGFAWTALALILLLALTSALFDNPVFGTLNIVLVPGLIAMHLAYLLSSRRLDWSSPKLILDAADHLIPQNIRHWATAVKEVWRLAARRKEGAHSGTAGKILIGVIIALPLLLIVISLLASADGIFDRFVSAVPNWLEGLSLGEGVPRALWIGFFGLAFFGYLWGFVAPMTYPKPPQNWQAAYGQGVNDPAVQAPAAPAPTIALLRIDPVIAATVLIAVNAVYLLFVAVQFTYLFGAWKGLLPEGMSYAEYARSGFFQLVAVSVINYVLLIGTLVFGEAGSGGLRRLNRALLYVLTGCSAVMLYSAYMRLVLYEEAYGYTYIRFLVHAFMLVLAVLLLTAGLRIRYAAVPLGKCFIVIGLVSYVALNYIGMDRIIAAQNIQRYADTGRLDAAYLLDLAPDAVPQLIRFSRDAYPGLENGLRAKSKELSRTDHAWPAFNLARRRAERLLEDYAGE